MTHMYFSARTEGRISYGHLGRTSLFFSVTAAVNIFLYAYYGWPAPMALAFRQPSIDIFAMCLIICQISLW